MNAILNMLIRDLEHEERIAVTNRVKLMLGELSYLSEKKPSIIEDAKKRGWSHKRLEVAFILNSFYQRIIRPLWASSDPPRVLGKTIPVRYGKKIVFDKDRNQAVTKMGLKFFKLCYELGIDRDLLESQKAGDLIWRLNHPRNER